MQKELGLKTNSLLAIREAEDPKLVSQAGMVRVKHAALGAHGSGSSPCSAVRAVGLGPASWPQLPVSVNVGLA